nr:nucleotide-binding alpha-beta plait domain-containing protein [Tanacetum cinerariifolium]
MGSYRSKEDEVVKISTSVFVANFLDSFGAKDLWNTCNQYGQVVDAYIPYRRSKAGKRFGFVRFIKVLDVDRLVDNLCTVWVGRHKLQANISRFQKEPLKRHNSLHNIDGVKGDSDSSPVMVLDDSCLNEKDYSICLMGKVNDFVTLANLKVVVANEEFDNIKFKYMGGRVTWGEIEVIPLKMWSKNKFNHVASKWGVLLDVNDQEDEHFHMKRICIKTNVPTNIFEYFKLIYRGKVFWVRPKEVPGWISYFVEDSDEEEDSEVGSYEEVSNGEDVKNVEDLEGDSDGEIVPDTKFEEDFPNQKSEEDSVGQGNVQSEDHFNIYELLNHKRPVIDNNSNSKESLKYPPGYTPTGSHFNKSEVPKSGGSILQLIDDLVKVGETMGASVGNSGEILCVWDPNMFKNTKSTASDYFVMVRGDWMPNGKKLLIISVYAPQELSEKKMLWDYLSLVISKWEGKVVIMGDFNEVRNKSKRFGTLFNRHGADVFNRFISSAGLDEDDHIIESNALIRMMKKLKCLKEKIREGENNIVNRRTDVVKLLQEVENKNYLEAAQKAKIKWAIEGDENSKYYHGVINKKRNQLSIRGILVEGTWIDSPSLVKKEIKKEVWDCGIDKSPGPDEFTFGFYRRPISLIGSMYKIISKILANRLVVVLGSLVNEIQSAFGADKQILDDDIMRQFGFGEKWCMWIQSCLRSSRGSVIVNGSPTEEFRFYKGFKQGLFKGIELEHSLNLSHMFYADDAIFIVEVEDTLDWRRLTLLKPVLGSMPIYHMSLFKVPKKVWRFITQGSSLWARVIKALHGYDGKIGQKVKSCYPSLWLDIIHEVEMFKSRGIDLVICFGNSKKIDVASKLSHSGRDVSFRRPPRGGVEIQQFEHMKDKVEGCILADMMDRWFWALEGSGEFTVTSVRKMIDDFMLPEVSSKTRWIKAVLIKVNVHAWKVKLDGLPTRLNISCRGIDIESILCPMCGKAVESTSHIFFTCQMSKEILRKISRWWDIDYMEISSYEKWLD